MRATTIAAIYGACGVAILTFYALHQWLAPSFPMMIGAVAIMIPAIVLVVVLEEDARPPGVDGLLVAQAILIAAIFGIALPATWTVPEVRTRALSTFQSQRSVQKALRDPQTEVRIAACGLMFDDELDFRPDAPTAALFEHSELAMECLPKVADAQAASETARKLALLWHQTLVAGDERDCDKVEPIDNLPIPEWTRAALLLDCSLQAEAVEVRGCCARRLTTAYQGEQLYTAASEGGELLQQLGASGPFIAAAFEEENFMGGVGHPTASLGLNSDKFRSLSAELACAAVLTGVDRTNSNAYLKWLFDSNAGCLSPEQKETPLDVPLACNALLKEDLKTKADLGATLCAANLGVRERVAAAAARVRTGTDFAEFSDSIDAGKQNLAKTKFSAGNLHQLIQSGEQFGTEERALIQDALTDIARQTARESRDQGNMRSARQQGRAVRSEEGRAKLREGYMEDMLSNSGNLEQAMGISAEELAASVGEDGEVSEEMKERIEKAKAEAEAPE